MKEHWSRIITLVLLWLIVLGGAYARLWHLIPPARGIEYGPDTDEGAYAFSAQLMLQGQVPYRDFFATLPPAALYLFAIVLGLFYHPWGSLTGFMALRYASVLYGLATIGVVYLIGRRLGGKACGLLAAAVLACDGIVIGMDRRAMLETPMNLFSALAIWAYVEAILREKSSRRGLALAGALSAVAVMIKSQAAIVPLLLVGVTLIRRRWSELWPLVASGIGMGLVLAGPFLILCPDQFLKQIYGFQLVRPSDGVISIEARLREIWGYPYSWLTLRLCWVGAGVLAFNVLGERHFRSAGHLKRKAPRWVGWLLVVLWAGASIALIVLSRSYWGTYYAQLAVPLAVLAGGLLAKSEHVASGRWQSTLQRAAPVVVLLAFLAWGIGWEHFAVQFGATKVLLGFSKPAYVQIMHYLQAHAGSQETVLATDPLYNMLASRALARGEGRPYLADSYGGMLYQSLGLAEMSWPQLWARRREIDAHPLNDNGQLTTLFFHQESVQADILAAFEKADYVVVDHRARRQWAPSTIRQIEEASTVVLVVDNVILLAHHVPRVSEALGTGQGAWRVDG